MIEALRREAARSGQRRLVVTSEPPDLPGARRLPGDEPPLGTTCDVLVVDLRAGLDPDGLGRAVGTVRGGGLVVLVVPEGGLPTPEGLAAWPFGPDDVGRRFERRFLATALAFAGGHATPDAPAPLPGPFATDDQRRAVEAVVRSLRRPRRPVVLLSDRGRGKTSALGLAISRALDEGLVGDVLVTAPDEDAVGPLLARLGVGAFPARGGRVRFARPDAVDAAGAGWLVVDEAAGIPLGRLLRWTAEARRISLATTVHGYEGTGRAFAVRYAPALRRLVPRAREIRLEAPARWAPDDPVEAWLDHALLLSAEPGPLPEGSDSPPERLDRDALAADEALLAEVHGLLVAAHYRTRPSDLRRMLDAPNLAVWAVRRGGAAVATALVADEGGFDEATAEAIGAGRARPLAHLVPETFAAHLGRPAFAGLTGVRIVRLAVRAERRRAGVGTALVRAIAADASARGRDWWGAAFGAEPELVGFWTACGCRPVRIGQRSGASTGLVSLVVLRALTDAASRPIDDAAARLGRDLADLLADPLRTLDPDVALAVLRAAPPPPDPGLDAQEQAEVARCAAGGGRFEWSVRPVRETVRARLPRSALDAAHARILVVRALQLRPWEATARACGLDGPIPATKAFRAALRALLRIAGTG